MEGAHRGSAEVRRRVRQLPSGAHAPGKTLGIPAVIDRRVPDRITPAGYEASKLDSTLRAYVAVAEKSIRHAKSLGDRVEKVLEKLADTPATADQAGEITMLYDRMTKASLQIVKAMDELTRLRSFLAGGPDSRPDLTVKGEIELRALVLTAVKTLGLKVVEA